MLLSIFCPQRSHTIHSGIELATLKRRRVVSPVPPTQSTTTHFLFLDTKVKI